MFWDISSLLTIIFVLVLGEPCTRILAAYIYIYLNILNVGMALLVRCRVKALEYPLLSYHLYPLHILPRWWRRWGVANQK